MYNFKPTKSNFHNQTKEHTVKMSTGIQADDWNSRNPIQAPGNCHAG